jgi:glycerol kinase
VWSSTAELAETWRLDERFEPGEQSAHSTTYDRWRAAVERAKGWDAG